MVICQLILSSCSFAASKVISPDENPFQFTIINEAYSDDAIHAVISLKSEKRWSTEDVAVSYTGVRDGEIISQNIESVANLINKKTIVESSSDSLYVPITITGEKLTDYQITFLWGHSAREKLKPVPKPILKDIQITEGQNYEIIAKLVNEGTGILENSVIGVSFLWIPEGKTVDLDSLVYENEEEVPLEGMAIEPGGEKIIKFTLPKPTNIREGGKLKPNIRLIK